MLRVKILEKTKDDHSFLAIQKEMTMMDQEVADTNST